MGHMPFDEVSLLREISQIFRKSIRKIHQNIRKNDPEVKEIYMLNQMTGALVKIRKELKTNRNLSALSKAKLEALLARIYENEQKKGQVGSKKKLNIEEPKICEPETLEKQPEKIEGQPIDDVPRGTEIEEEITEEMPTNESENTPNPDRLE